MTKRGKTLLELGLIRRAVEKRAMVWEPDEAYLRQRPEFRPFSGARVGISSTPGDEENCWMGLQEEGPEGKKVETLLWQVSHGVPVPQAKESLAFYQNLHPEREYRLGPVFRVLPEIGKEGVVEYLIPKHIDFDEPFSSVWKVANRSKAQ